MHVMNTRSWTSPRDPWLTGYAPGYWRDIAIASLTKHLSKGIVLPFENAEGKHPYKTEAPETTTSRVVDQGNSPTGSWVTADQPRSQPTSRT